MIHPLVIGELACGNLADRKHTLEDLKALPRVIVASDEEVLVFIENHHLAGTGLGIVDLHLLASAHLSGVRIWSADRALQAAARKTNVEWTEVG